MKIKDGFMLREMQGSTVVIATGDAARNFKGMIRLNKTGTFLWKQLEKETSQEELLAAVLEKYETDRKTAEEAMEGFLKTVRAHGFLVE